MIGRVGREFVDHPETRGVGDPFSGVDVALNVHGRVGPANPLSTAPNFAQKSPNSRTTE